MAKTRLERIAEVPALEMEPVRAPAPQQCDNCKGWNSNNGTIGQCLPSGKYLSAPLVTTNTTNCREWAARAS